jgi:hypothetical protein
VGRREVPVPDDAPAKPLADYLRQLRRDAGNPGYRQLGELAFCTHHALSQSVDGRYIPWSAVERYVKALAKHSPGVVTEDDWLELKKLHAVIDEVHSQERLRKKQKTKGARTSGRVGQFWDEHDEARQVAQEAAATRAPGQWHTTRLATARGLNTAQTFADLALVLKHLITRQTLVAGPPTSQGGEGIPQLHPLERQVLSSGKDATLDQVMALVRLYGGTDGDCLAWKSAWDRISTSGPFVGLVSAVGLQLAAPSRSPSWADATTENLPVVSPVDRGFIARLVSHIRRSDR